jgi:cell division protein FtsQ
MKGIFKIVGMLVVAIGVIVVLISANNFQSESKLHTPEIFIDVQGEFAFLTESELYQRIKKSDLLPESNRISALQIEKIEKFIKNMSEVLDAKVYVNIGGTWNIDVKIRKPIARVFNTKGESFYLDELGYKIQPSYLYTARVVVVTGAIYDSKDDKSVSEIINNPHLINNYQIDDIYRISHYVCKNPFLLSMIGQIHRQENGDFLLIPRVGNHKIIFGSAYSNSEVRTKFRKLANFYSDGLPYEGWSAYDCINLKFDNQVVCSKKQL